MLLRSILAATLGLLAGVGLTPSYAESIKVGGSGGGLRILQLLGLDYAKKHPGDRIEVVPSLGSAGGIAAVNGRAIDLAVSWRSLNAKEVSWPLHEIPFLETPFVFATTHSQGGSIARDDITKIFGGTLSTWPDGSPLRIILRPKSDSNSLFMVENIPGMQAALEQTRQRTDVPTAASDQDNLVLADKTEGVLTGISLLQLQGDPGHRLKVLAIDNVVPSLDRLRDGTYPYRIRMRVVFAHTRTPATERFLTYLAGKDAEAIIQQHGAFRFAMQIPR
ncbi:MAG: PstS family phosphate ABC transporter substrate-binding protein [Hyphomicrobiaceae bacterium]